MLRKTNLAGLAVLALLLSAMASPAAAQYREEQAGRIGAGTVLRIFEGNRFHRCAAHFANPDVLRIAFTTGRKYSISVPSVSPVPGRSLAIVVTSTPPAATYANAALTDGNRTFAELPLPTVEGLMRFRGPLLVEAGNRRFQWSLGASVQDVLMAVENCTNRASGWR